MTMALFFLLVLATLWLSRLAQGGLRRAFAIRGVTDAGTVGVATRLVRYAVVILGLGVGLQTLGVDLGALVAAGAFFAVALGFAMQNVAQNFVAGLILLTERTIKPGDVLEVEGRVVRVSGMGLRATVARTRDEEDIIIPNTTLVQNSVINYTLRDPTYRIHTKVGVSYDSDVPEVMQVLLQAAESVPERLPSHDPRVMFLEFGDSALQFDVSIWSQDPWGARGLRSSLNVQIWAALRDARIQVPFPQRDVHIVSMPLVEAAAADRSSALTPPNTDR